METNGVISTLDEDNLPARQKSVLERLGQIRSMKQRILDTLNGMKKDKEDEDLDKAMMAKLLQAYDNFKNQEDEYVGILQQILAIRTTAADDVATELAKAVTESAIAGDDSMPMVESTTENINAERAALADCAEKAIIASRVHDQLVTSLQLNRNKKAVLSEIHAEQRDQQLTKAQHALRQAELTRERLLAEQTAIEEKRAELEQLRAQARTQGLAPRPPAAEQQQSQRHEAKSSVDATGQQQEKKNPPPPSSSSSAKKNKKKQQQQSSEDQKDPALDSAIAEKLAAIKARKERIREVTARLGHADRLAMDDTYLAAQEQLRRLTAMRERLENLQQAATSLGDEGKEEETLAVDGVRVETKTCQDNTEPGTLTGVEQALAEQEAHIAQLMRAVEQVKVNGVQLVEQAEHDELEVKNEKQPQEENKESLSLIDVIRNWLKNHQDVNFDARLIEQLRGVVSSSANGEQETIEKVDKVIASYEKNDGQVVSEIGERFLTELTEALEKH